MIPYLLAAVGGYLIGDSSSEKFAKGGLIAPNGKPSNLTPEQYKLVRTPEFKAWFGDWENNPESASKVVDENGEPLVCYHGSRSEFNEFKINEKSHWDIFWFSPNYETAKMHAEDDEYERTPNIYKCFLNVRNISKTYPFDLNKYDGFIDYKIDMDWINFKQIKHIQVVQVVNSNQIKLADGTNTTFNNNNPDIRYAKGGITKSDAFKNWFSNSKVVDLKGKPKIMYHGTRKNFTEFKKGEHKNTNHPSASLGFFFADYRIAQMFATPNWEDISLKQEYYNSRRKELGIYKLEIELKNTSGWNLNKYDALQSSIYKREERIDNEWGKITNWIKRLDYGVGASLIPVYLSIQNPYEMSFKEILDLGGGPNDSEEKIEKRVKILKDKLIKEGYDGIKILPSEISSESEFEQYVAFRPNQIKSAISNTTFDSNNPDIRFADGGLITEDKIEVFGLDNYTISKKSGRFYHIYAKRKIGDELDENWWIRFSRKDGVNNLYYIENKIINTNDEIELYFPTKKLILSELPKSLLDIYNNPDIRYKAGGKVWNDKELLKRYKNGESIGFTATAHLKAQGLIPRADGTKRKSMADGANKFL